MGGVKVDIIWSPNHDDRFVTFGTDLSLYKIEPAKDAPVKPQGAFKVSDETLATLLSVNSENQFIKCLAWYPKPNPDHLLAVGLANGKVVLSSFGKGGTSDPQGLIGKEFVPKHVRQCNHLAWNPVDSNLLAEGLDKYRTDHSVLIWDVNMTYTDKSASEKRNSATTDPGSATKPFIELGPTSESTLSLAWFTTDPKSLVTGMNHKFLKIFDLREIMRPRYMAYTKAVYGVSVDPHFENRLASFAENSISVWDVRNFDKPLLTLTDTKPVMKIAWSPTRSGLLSALHKDSSVVKLYDIQNTPMGSDELEPSVIERIVQPHKNQILSSFDWHCTQDNRMLTATSASAIQDIKVFERISLSWSSDIHLSWACGRQLVQCNTVKLNSNANDDISIKMKRRACHGYGIKNENMSHNVQLVDKNRPLKNLWNWLHYIQGLQLHEDGRGRRGSPGNVMVYQGVKTMLLGDGTSLLRSDAEQLQWQGLEGQKVRGGRKIYTCEERSHALQLCGWGYNRNQYQLNDALARSESEGNFERAAAISLFNLNMNQAIETLQRATIVNSKSDKGNIAEGNFSVVAMALSGFTEDNALWQQLCSKEKSQLKNPYLRTMFAFLTTDPDQYEEMLNDSQMEVIDKVAFATMYLSDTKLADFIKKLSLNLVESGDLNGIVLTGICKEGLDLLERYVDHTCDVQTACLVALQGMQLLEVSEDSRPRHWIETYRDLLDQWKLWHQRAEFDLYYTSCEPKARPVPQVFATCNFCGKPIAYNMLASRNRSFMLGGTTSHRPKVTSCPNCRKPLPRCALCLINMGTPAGQGKPKSIKDSAHENERKLTQFSEWFTWCQSCRHGGHAHHLMEWFKDHSECPVTGCSCRCTSLDSLGNVSTDGPQSPSHRALTTVA